ncbi:MAG TPA: flagellar hook capping FlgD N-terminal domain-containing protein [Rhizomicrobium sp.]
MTTPVNATNSGAANSSSPPTSQQQLAGNFQTFLTLLTTQLKNQDPTAPMDSTQFTQQLVMYSQVEQQIGTNTKLDSLISLGQSQFNNFSVSYLGKNVVVTDGTASLREGAAEWTYALDGTAAATKLTVSDASGKTVFTKSGETAAGTHGFTWDGKDLNGNQLNDGTYKLTVTSTAEDGSKIATSVASKDIVIGIDLSGSSPQLIIGTREVPLSSVTLITN